MSTISPMATVYLQSPNYSSRNGRALERITIHCFVGQVTARRGCEVFVPREKEASANYVVGKDGDVGCSVPEEFRSWCSSDRDNDERAITIETASDTSDPYAVTPAAFDAVVDLCADICRRYGKKKLTWIPDKSRALAYKVAPDELILTVHRWFANKACPGAYLMSRMGDIAEEVTEMLQDNKPGDWSKEAREWATEKGLIAGYGGGDMGWTDPVTREQLAVILKRYDDARSMD